MTIQYKNAVWLLLLLASSAWAESEAEIELLSAQKAYQMTLSVQKEKQTRADAALVKLRNAQNQLKTAQDNLDNVQSSFNAVDIERQQADEALQAAGSRLDAAWHEVHPDH